MNEAVIKKGKVAVIGLTGQSAFLQTEYLPGPGETIPCSGLFFEPGGKGHNQAIACRRTGAGTLFIGAVGSDANGKACRTALGQEGIELCLMEKESPTAFAVITTARDGENVVEVYGGAALGLGAEDLKSGKVRGAIQECDYLLLQNELQGECLRTAIDIAQESGVPVILNPAPARNLEPSLLSRCRIVTPNYGEAKELAGFGPEEEPSPEELAGFFRRSRIENTMITMGGRGVLLITDSRCEMIPAFSAGPVVDTTGAGDTFNGVLAGMLSGGAPLEQAILTAVTAAGISVTRPGAAGSIPDMGEILERQLDQ